VLPVWLPPTLTAAPAVPAGPVTSGHDEEPVTQSAGSPAGSGWEGRPVEFDAVVPPSGNMSVTGRQFWLAQLERV
jgi:hypothetical protein